MGDIPAESAGLLLMLLGVLGFVGGVIVGRSKSTGGAFMLIAGILGFFILFALWIIQWIIMIVGWIPTFRSPEC
jgi:protein-S-isoprenylcysteine O-methyltransferase Ste14